MKTASCERDNESMPTSVPCTPLHLPSSLTKAAAIISAARVRQLMLVDPSPLRHTCAVMTLTTTSDSFSKNRFFKFKRKVNKAERFCENWHLKFIYFVLVNFVLIESPNKFSHSALMVSLSPNIEISAILNLSNNLDNMALLC